MHVTGECMHEIMGLRFRGIEWNDVRGNIKYDDAGMKPAPQKKQTAE